MKIDIDRLHEVLEGKRVRRGSGFTFAGLCRVAGMASLLDGKKVAFVAHERHHADECRKLFNEILIAMDMDADIVGNYKDRVEFNNGCIVYFYSASNQRVFDNGLRGVRLENIEVDHYAAGRLTNETIETINISLI